MTHYEVGKKYKKIATVAKIHKDVPSVFLIDDKRYVLETTQPKGKDGRHGTRKSGSSVRESNKLHK